ncbi:glycoside hydrolase family 43 protein [Auriscalpium vulgare]|uniref:Glycoside hydrolase family 43 protein n=1 Tax=Auriscalpium vulgare TaxID=40419 RepID=A0ACB8RY92_9AGAM|nr:glycoside hydrolase family 43 protein [Auriscalpium vulgare]
MLLRYLLSAISAAVDVRSAPGSGTYSNPVIPGFSPDPSCTRRNGTFFCVNSSFNAFPGVPVYASRDLQHFKQIGNVISRVEQVPGLATTNGTTSGIWAATIRENDGTFYVTTTLVFDNKDQLDLTRWQNMLFTTKNPFAKEAWSDPIPFYFPGYDTSLFWDDDGKVWVQGSHAWHVYPQIQQYQIDLATGLSLSGDPQAMWNGTGGLAPEGPHVYKKDGWYYLLLAEGGTGVGHMATMARASAITGPYEPFEHNPVLTNANTTLYWQTVGHTDIFTDTAGNYWAVALSTRNGTANFPMGRETILTPVVWSGDWPVFNGAVPGHIYPQMSGPLPVPKSAVAGESLAWELASTSGLLAGADEYQNFEPGSTFPLHYLFLRLPDTSKYAISPPGHPFTLALKGSALNLTGTDRRTGNPTFVGRRQTQVKFYASVDLSFTPTQDGEEAGLTIFLTQAQHFDVGVVALSGASARAQGYPEAQGDAVETYIRLRTVTTSSSLQGAVDPISKPAILPLAQDDQQRLSLRVEAPNETSYEFSYAQQGSNQWHVIGSGDATEVSGGFVGTIVGMFASGNGADSATVAYFSNFVYTGKD